MACYRYRDGHRDGIRLSLLMRGLSARSALRNVTV